MTQKQKSNGVSDSLALGLLKSEQEAHPDANIVLSPLSVSLALAMTVNGSRGQTRQDTVTALGFGYGRSRRGINESYLALRKSISATQNLDFSIVNGLVGSSDLRFKPNFVNKSKQYFDAEIRCLDTNDPASIVLMNALICQKTRGKVPSILEEIDEGCRQQLVFLNAVYFRGNFQQGFPPLLTQSEPFYRLDGSVTESALMYREGEFDYLQSLKYQAAKLPYGQDGRFAFYVFLPLAQGEFGLHRLKSALSEDGFNECFERFSPRQGKVFLPRFKIDYAVNLNNSLAGLGFAGLFDAEKAELDSLVKSESKPRLTLKHKTVFELSEAGASFASVTPQANAAIRLHSCIPPQLPFVLRADRPFFFFVRDEESKILCVSGFINDPGA